MLYLGIGNIRRASLFPRDPKRIEYVPCVNCLISDRRQHCSVLDSFLFNIEFLISSVQLTTLIRVLKHSMT